MDISIIIINYNTKTIVKNCLDSIFEHTKIIDFEVIVVDNASSDGSQQMLKTYFPKISLIENNLNLGFGRANNLGAKIAKGKYLFLLNSDCILIENTAKAFFDYMETNNIDGSIGAVGALLYDKSMKLNTSYQKFPTILSELKWILFGHINKLFPRLIDLPQLSNYSLLQLNEEVEYIIGADLFTLKKSFDELNGFDEQFFLFFEETDLQKRMCLKGLRRIILKDQKIIHLESQSTKTSAPTLKSSTLFRNSMYKYLRKNSSSILYFLFYFTYTPLIISPLFSKKYSLKEKKRYLKMLLRIPLVEAML